MSDAPRHFYDHEETYPPPPTGQPASDGSSAYDGPAHSLTSTHAVTPTHGAPPAHVAEPIPGALPVAAPNHEVPDVEALLLEAIEMIETARPAPLSTAIKIEGEPLLDVLYDVRERLPDELRAARWLLRDRDEHLASQRLEGEEIIALARSRAERLVERTEVVRSAEQRAQRIISEAKAEARQMRRETEDFCDARLASLEGILDRTRTVVATGRARLQGTETIDLSVAETVLFEADEEADERNVDEPPAPVPAQRSVGLFDQDLT